MDDDTRAILNNIVATSENPLADIMANLAGGKSSATVTIGKKRPRSDSDSADGIPSFRQFLDRMFSGLSEALSDAVPSSTSAEAGPSSSSENKKSEGKKESGDSENEPESLVERVKRQRLGEHERLFVEGIVDTAKITTNFESVHLPEDIVDTLRSLVSLPLLCPEEFQCGILKRHTMSGALLFGPPGTGKTLFAQAVAKESGANMITVKPSDILDKWVGESEKLVRGLFKLARRLEPCVVFIDELDALFGARTHAGQQSSARWHTSTLTEFMQEMDGLISSEVVVIGATNRPFDLDDAVLRRLPCRVLIDLPDKAARHAILKILLRDEALAEDAKLEWLADMTDKFSGSDLKNLCLAAAFNAVKDNITVPWKTGSKKGKERAPGESTFIRPSDKPYATITPVSEPAGASITEVPDFAASVTSPGGTTMESPSDTLKPTTSIEGSDASSDPSSAESKPAPEPARERQSPFVTSRILAKKHFSQALNQVGPSSSDSQTTLGEIRTWNSKFGSGGNKLAGILGGGYSGRTGVPPFNPSGAGTGIPGYGARPGGSSLFGGSGSGSGTGVPGLSGSSTGIPGITGSGLGIPGISGSGAGTGIPGYGASSAGAYGGSGSAMGGSGLGGSGLGLLSGTGTSIPGITGTGVSTGLPRFDPAGGQENTARPDQGGASGSSMGHTVPGGPGAGTSVQAYSGTGAGLNFGAGGLRPGGGSWPKAPGSGSGLGSDDIDMASIAAAAARQMGAGSGTSLSSYGALAKAVDV